MALCSGQRLGLTGPLLCCGLLDTPGFPGVVSQQAPLQGRSGRSPRSHTPWPALAPAGPGSRPPVTVQREGWDPRPRAARGSYLFPTLSPAGVLQGGLFGPEESSQRDGGVGVGGDLAEVTPVWVRG